MKESNFVKQEYSFDELKNKNLEYLKHLNGCGLISDSMLKKCNMYQEREITKIDSQIKDFLNSESLSYLIYVAYKNPSKFENDYNDKSFYQLKSELEDIKKTIN